MSEFHDWKWYEETEKLPVRKDDQETITAKETHTWKKVLAGVLAGVMVTAGSFSGYMIYDKNRTPEEPPVVATTNKTIEGATLTHLSDTEREAKTVVEIAQEVGPAVVGITNKAQVQSFFGITEQEGTGSGVILSADGYILTNYHVIEGANEVTVQTSTGKDYPATLVGADSVTDLALIKIEPEDELTVATLGDSSKVQVGELAVAIGNPLGLELAGTVTVGVISAVNRSIETENSTMTLLQTDAAINPGNSGGALVNAYGEVIGINNMKFSGDDVEGIGFAIPSDTVKSVIEDLKAYGYVKGRPLLGVTIQEITPEIAFKNDLPIGLYVADVSTLGAADRAGIQKGDVIVKANGQKVETSDQLNEIKNAMKVGDVLTLQVVRDGKKMDIDVTLQEDRTNKPMDSASSQGAN